MSEKLPSFGDLVTETLKNAGGQLFDPNPEFRLIGPDDLKVARIVPLGKAKFLGVKDGKPVFEYEV